MKTFIKKIVSNALHFFLIGFLFSNVSFATQDYPNRPIHLIVPFAPGGGADATARLVGQGFSESLGVSIVIENYGGAGGNIGTTRVMEAPPDGYTLLLTTNGISISPHLSKKNISPLITLAHIGMVVTYPLVISSNPKTPGNSLAEMVNYAKQNPNALSYGSSGTGGPLHMGAELFKNRAGVQILHIPYKGNAPANLAVVQGEVSMTFDTLFGPVPFIKSGKLKALAVTGKSRSNLLPEVPTVAESGYPDFYYYSWNGLSAPPKTPIEILEKVNQALQEALKKPAIQSKLIAWGYIPAPGSIENYTSVIQSDYERFGKLIKELGLEVN